MEKSIEYGILEMEGSKMVKSCDTCAKKDLCTEEIKKLAEKLTTPFYCYQPSWHAKENGLTSVPKKIEKARDGDYYLIYYEEYPKSPHAVTIDHTHEWEEIWEGEDECLRKCEICGLVERHKHIWEPFEDGEVCMICGCMNERENVEEKPLLRRDKNE